MNKQPKVSVIIPIYNSGKHLDRCLSSVVDQVYTNLEILLINDGSSDNSASVCKEYAKKDKRIHYYHKDNGGVSSARNFGMRKATGTYITFVDSDDVITKDSLDILVCSINDADISMIKEIETISTDHIKQTNENNQSAYISGIDAAKKLLYENGVNNTIHGLMYVKDIAKDIYFNEKISYGEDYEFKFYLLINAKNVVTNSRVGYLYINHVGSAMNAIFTEKRADSLIVARSILDQTNKHIPQLVKAAKHKVFLESVSIIRAIGNRKSHKSIYDECSFYIKNYRSSVIADKDAPLQHRIYAAISIVNTSILIWLINIKNRIFKGVG